ncbi:hypothetical protein [Helicobacter sp. T3_23-1056]
MSEKQIYTNKDANIANLETDSRANQNPKRYDKNGDEILWEGKKKYHPVGLFLFIAFWCGGGLAIWTMWHFMRVESLWYGVPLICFVGIACLFGYYCINLRKIYLTTKGLWIHTRFNGDIFYPYGYFVIESQTSGGFQNWEMIEIHSFQKSSKTFMFPVVRGSMGVFMNNDDFKRICSKQTQKALESMLIKDISNLYAIFTKLEPKKIYMPSYNVFNIDFSIYKQNINTYKGIK